MPSSPSPTTCPESFADAVREIVTADQDFDHSNCSDDCTNKWAQQKRIEDLVAAILASHEADIKRRLKDGR